MLDTVGPLSVATTSRKRPAIQNPKPSQSNYYSWTHINDYLSLPFCKRPLDVWFDLLVRWKYTTLLIAIALDMSYKFKSNWLYSYEYIPVISYNATVFQW